MKVLVTGSSGLVGSACVRHFHGLGWQVDGLDNNYRAGFFGEDGDTERNRHALQHECVGFRYWPYSVRHPQKVPDLLERIQPDLVIHAAAQPSHDYAADHVFEDFETNMVGTLNLLEACRRHAPEAVFCFMSTNKVYGDWVNDINYHEYPTRYDIAPNHYVDHFGSMDEHGARTGGATEEMPIDQSTHSLFGCSKLAADLYVQEYGRYFGLKTVCFRAGCLTGGAHAAAEQHGFLAYLVKCCREGRPYRVYGYKGKQVRDNLHAFDVARACEEFYKNPRPGEVYNLGGGRDNSCSVLEAIALAEKATGRRLKWEYVDQPRKGDHICYISDTSKFRSHYPGWSVTRSLESIFAELAADPLTTSKRP